MSAAALNIEGVTKTFGGLRAVDGVSLEAEPGRVTGLIGSNGAGKTTLFNVVCGALKMDQGSVAFGDVDISNWPAWRVSSIGVIRTFQTPLGFPAMSVLESMLVFAGDRGDGLWSLVGHRRRLRSSEAQSLDKARTILGEVGLGGREDSLVHDLSAGELKILEFSRPLMADPRILLLDEPAAGVNPGRLPVIADHIAELKTKGMTFLVVDHNLRFIRDVCDYVYVMADGRIIYEGEPDAVMRSDIVIESYIGRGHKEVVSEKGA